MSTDFKYEKTHTLLKVSGVNLDLGGREILRDVNLEIKDIVRPGMTQGQIVGLLGPSGMGKTQLFRILSGLNVPDSGTVDMGNPLTPVQAGRVGVVAQDYPLFHNRTVMSNLVLASKQAGHAQPEEDSKRMLDRFDLGEHGDKFPAQLSGGQRQRVAIAQQLLCSEMFLLMDEPFSGLDPLAVDAMCNLLVEVACTNEEKTLIVVTHDISAALRVCDTLLLLGRDHDETGKPIPGARIQHEIDLIERGLAWQPGLHQTPQFFAAEAEIHAQFATL